MVGTGAGIVVVVHHCNEGCVGVMTLVVLLLLPGGNVVVGGGGGSGDRKENMTAHRYSGKSYGWNYS